MLFHFNCYLNYNHFFIYREQFIIESAAFRTTPIHEEFMIKKAQNCLSDLISLRDIACNITASMGYNVDNLSLSSSLVEEVLYFLRIGDFEVKAGKIICINPTLLTLEDNLWQVNATNKAVLKLSKM